MNSCENAIVKNIVFNGDITASFIINSFIIIGKIVKTDYISLALNNLVELYKKIGDKVEKGNIQEIKSKAKEEGLSRKEINDISRLYGIEFGEKAFSKIIMPSRQRISLRDDNASCFFFTNIRESIYKHLHHHFNVPP